MAIQIATAQDVPALVRLLDRAYRGEPSKKGWTTEANLLQGDRRTDEPTLLQLMQSLGSIFLKYTNDQGILTGCVFLQPNDTKLYLGMLSVDPDGQAGGIGKQLMTAATAYAREKNLEAIFMRVISVRHELVNWYNKLGYVDTGIREPFKVDERFGVPTQPLEFIILEKQLNS